jgi:hypothetical protein
MPDDQGNPRVAPCNLSNSMPMATFVLLVFEKLLPPHAEFVGELDLNGQTLYQLKLI